MTTYLPEDGKIRITDKITISDTLLEIFFIDLSGQIDKFIPGQYLTLKIKDFYRSYSISGLHKKKYRFIISICSGGKASDWWKNIEIGSTVPYLGPFGNFILPEKAQGKLMILVTGSGISPVLAMKQQIIQLAQSKFDLFLFHGIRNFIEAIDFDDFVSISQKYNNFDYKVFVSRQFVIENSFIKRGRFTCHIKNIIPSFNSLDMLYLCGNPNMIHEVFLEYQQLGCKITMERFW